MREQHLNNGISYEEQIGILREEKGGEQQKLLG
jgi:hypothetical protein